MNHKLDTDTQVFFYEQEFYVLSNFSSFSIVDRNLYFPTAEHLYHWRKFYNSNAGTYPQTILVADRVRTAPSAHEAFQIAQENKALRFQNWDEMKVPVMRHILRLKVAQHEYVKRKLLETGNRRLIEDSWRDDYWGWGPNKDGQNVLGKLWMELREELKTEE
jgi:ribA/ribD-fused uncharacterized protein